MKNDLTCGVARDLLPNYVDGHLYVELRQAVDRHLTGPDQSPDNSAAQVPVCLRRRRGGEVCQGILSDLLKWGPHLRRGPGIPSQYHRL